jgi:hypothetical protein
MRRSGGLGRKLRRRFRARCRCDLRGGLGLAGLFERHFFFELLAELPRHRASATHPATDLRDQTRQFLRPQYDESQSENDQQLEKPTLKHE